MTTIYNRTGNTPGASLSVANSELNSAAPKRRGRPPKHRTGEQDTRALLINSGVALLTERAFGSTGLDQILVAAGVPKGSFYYHFKNKEQFGLSVIESYGDYFHEKLKRHLRDTETAPLERIENFVSDARSGLVKHGYKRGCLIGNLGQEMSTLPESFRSALRQVFRCWQGELQYCLREAQEQGQVAKDLDIEGASAYFWIGWEGAVLRAKLEQSTEPMRLFADYFYTSVRAH